MGVTPPDLRGGNVMRRSFFCIWIVLFTIIVSNVFAKGPAKIWQEFEMLYQPAGHHRALEGAHEAPDSSKLKTYVVLTRGGIPAERAAFYIGWGDYDYRGVTIDGDKMTTRRGGVYTFLKTGDVLAVAGIDHMGRTLYLKLITPEVYIPENRAGEKRHSRVTTQVAFKLPKDVYKEDDAQKAMDLLGEWFKPFMSIDDAKKFAEGL